MASAASLAEYVEKQDDLLKEAALALPHSFSKCTYSLGHIRQAVYLCRDCPEAKGLCSACSVACHTDHDQIELFPKRNFRCDCPTSAVAHNCTLHTKLEEPNTLNEYGRNFKEEFCRCGRKYDANTEREAMIQCLACEDWFHESCCNLRERPSSREPSPAAQPQSDPPAEATTADIDDAASEASSSGLPPPLISGDDYESFVCAECVTKIATLKRFAGTPGFMMVVRSNPDEPWKVMNGDADSTKSSEVDPITVGTKRSRSPSPSGDASQPEAKRAKTENEQAKEGEQQPCVAPPVNTIAQTILESEDKSLGAGDLFLCEGFRQKWCQCNACLPSLVVNSFLLEEETTYEPPEDPDSGLSLEQLGMRALERLPRERAIDGIHAFNKMRDNLVKYLKPFADAGEEVKEDDVRSFFDELKEDAKRGKVH